MFKSQTLFLKIRECINILLSSQVFKSGLNNCSCSFQMRTLFLAQEGCCVCVLLFVWIRFNVSLVIHAFLLMNIGSNIIKTLKMLPGHSRNTPWPKHHTETSVVSCLQ